MLLFPELAEPMGSQFPKALLFPDLAEPIGLSIKRDWYQVIMSITTKPQSASFPRITRTYGLSIKRDWYHAGLLVGQIIGAKVRYRSKCLIYSSTVHLLPF